MRTLKRTKYCVQKYQSLSAFRSLPLNPRIQILTTKENMKTISTLLTICFLTMLPPCKTLAQTYDKTLLTITIYESADKGYNKILVFENTKKLEEIELSPFYYKNLDSHQPVINKVIIHYKQQGFKKESELRGSLDGHPGASAVMVTTYIFEK